MTELNAKIVEDFKNYCVNRNSTKLLTIDEVRKYYNDNIYWNYSVTWLEWLDKVIGFVNYWNEVLSEDVE